MMYIFRKILPLILIPVAILHPLYGKSQEQLRKYIGEGLSNNLVLQQKNISLQRSLLALKEARSWFYPSAELLGDYTWAEGGRTIDLPVGDMLNPVYSTLNKLTGSNAFPQIDNQQIQLMPRNFYDARFRIACPALNTDIIYNSRIREKQVILSEYEIETYRRELVKEIETAYYHFCMGLDAEKIYESALELVTRNLKINQSLVRNGKGLNANVLRAESELENVKSRLQEAVNLVKNATAWFNFLLNRPLSDTIIYESIPFPLNLAEKMAAQPVVDNRSELKALGTAGEIRNLQLDLNQRYFLPKINLFADLGSQAFNWQFDDKSRYLLAGVQLSMPVFEGFRNRIRIKDTRLEIENLQKQKEVTGLQFTVAANIAKNNLNTANGNFSSAEKQLQSARAYFHLIEKGYSEGINTLIEYLDARNQLTSSEIQLKLTRYHVLEAYSALMRETNENNY